MERDSSDQKPKKGGLFDDLSATQVIAGALAAVTSMLLASQIGIAGSVIGVGVGSIVSAVASQLYKKFLAASADKLKDLHPTEILAGGAQVESGSGVHVGDASRPLAAEKTAVLNPVARRASNTPSIDDAALADDATVLKVQSLRTNKRKLQRRVAAVAVASALVAVALTAFFVNFVTDGEGFGEKVSTLPYVQSQPTDEGAQQGNDSGSDKAPSDSASESGSSTSGDAKNDQSTDGKDDSASGSTDNGQQGGSTDPSNPSEGSGDQGTNGGSGDDGTEDGGQGSNNQGSGSGTNNGSSAGSQPNTGSSQGSGGAQGSTSASR
ncbi:hypothetical protein [Raoultibacter phocaeensis]|uniref:hypothetical protein n=1 Tax=Raoultibacter phocaeensis TaxID=2479841 RepID=UPI0011195913|nr:hypothetical protein [Raoultibacter phocaeensis]